MKIEKPILNGKTDRENLHILETWAGNLADTLNHEMNHLDESNLVPGVLVDEKALKNEMNRMYRELRELIINRTKGG